MSTAPAASPNPGLDSCPVLDSSPGPVPWDDAFEKLIRKAMPLLGDTPLGPATELRHHGLDSMASVQLLLETEEQYGISVPDELMEPTMFDTPGNLWAIVDQLLSAPTD